jgi:diguanylate cyclase (GGDEF)-like protein
MVGRGLGQIQAVFVLLVTAAALAFPAGEARRAAGGSINLSTSDFTSGRPDALDGEWRWYPEVRSTGAEVPTDTPVHVELPLSLPPARSQGVGTLMLSVVLPEGEELYGLKIPYMASANRVFVDGEELGGSGSLADPYRARYMPQELFFASDGGRVEIAIQVANRHHRRMRLTRVYLGGATQIRRFTHGRMMRDGLLFGSLLLLAAYHLVVFFLHRRERAFLFFAGIAGFAAFRLGVTTERILVRLWPSMPPELMMKLGYAPVFLLLPLIVLYLHELSPFDSFKGVARIARWMGTLFALMLLATPVRVYDWVFEYGLAPILLFGGYVLFLLFRRQIFESRQGSVVIAAGGIVILATGVNDYLREIGVTHTPELLSVGVLVFLLLQAYFLAWRFRTNYLHTRRLASEVQRLNRDLESRIAERTKELAEANDRLERISRTDGLTGIANRRYFDEAYERDWQHALRHGLAVSAILADIDHFKAYNDHHGHLEGDDCLRQIAEVLKTAARRGTDLVARYGGEEFMVLLPDADGEAARRVAEELRQAVEGLAIPHTASSTAPVVTVSFGVATVVPTDGERAEALLRRADTALYEAKAHGRNRVEAAEPIEGSPARE